MTQQKTHIITRRRRLFEVTFISFEGDRQYKETQFFRTCREQLEEEVRGALFTHMDKDRFFDEITWTFEHQYATKKDRSVDGHPRYPRHLEVNAREIDSLEDLRIREL